STGSLAFDAYNGITPPLTITGAGSLTLASGNALTVTVSNAGSPLPAATGLYKLIAKGSGNTTAANGTAPVFVTVGGDGIQGTPASAINSAELFLNACGAITISAQPSSQTVCLNSNGTFSVTASGGSPFTYMWRKRGN